MDYKNAPQPPQKHVENKAEPLSSQDNMPHFEPLLKMRRCLSSCYIHRRYTMKWNGFLTQQQVYYLLISSYIKDNLFSTWMMSNYLYLEVISYFAIFLNNCRAFPVVTYIGTRK